MQDSYTIAVFLIWKDPLVEATRTKSLGLMHKQLCKDSAMCRQGLPDYVITMRKPGENEEPIAHADGLDRFFGEDEPEGIKGDRPAPDMEKYAKKKNITKCLYILIRYGEDTQVLYGWTLDSPIHLIK